MLTVSLRDEAGLAVGALDERVAHVRHGVGDRPHDGVADEVGEADLAHAAAGAVAVDHLAVDLEQLGRDVAEAGRRRHGEAALHVGGDGRAGAADRGARLSAAAGCRGLRRWPAARWRLAGVGRSPGSAARCRGRGRRGARRPASAAAAARSSSTGGGRCGGRGASRAGLVDL